MKSEGLRLTTVAQILKRNSLSQVPQESDHLQNWQIFPSTEWLFSSKAFITRCKLSRLHWHLVMALFYALLSRGLVFTKLTPQLCHVLIHQQAKSELLVLKFAKDLPYLGIISLLRGPHTEVSTQAVSFRIANRLRSGRNRCTNRVLPCTSYLTSFIYIGQPVLWFCNEVHLTGSQMSRNGNVNSLTAQGNLLFPTLLSSMSLLTWPAACISCFHNFP